MKKIFSLLCLLLPLASSAIDTLVLSDIRKDYVPSGAYYELMEDKSRGMEADSILNPSNQEKFKVLPEELYTNVELDSYYWTRFVVQKGSNTQIWLMELVDPHIEYIDVYEYNGKKLVPFQKTNGFVFPFSTKEFFHKNYVYNLDLSDGKAHTIYIRFRSSVHNSLSLKLRSAEYLLSYSIVEYYLLGLYYGILLIMALYNLFIFFSVRERTYIYYVFYVIACGFNSMNEDGLGFQFLWPNAPWVNTYSIRIIPLVLLGAFALYSTSFLGLAKRNPLLNKIAFGLVGLNIVLFAINGLFYNFDLNFQLVYLFAFAFIYGVAVYIVYNGYKPARYFLLGYSFILVSFFVFYLRSKGIEVFHHFFAVYSFNYGFILEVVILSYALSERLREEKKQKESAQRLMIEQLQENDRIKDELNKELERKVKERTAELQEANEEINRMNEYLSTHNLKLQADVKQISKERIMQREVSFEEFKLTYPNEEACFQFLSDLKWINGYHCRKCQNDKFSSMNNLARRCNKCKYIESPTAFTIFHSIKFSILDAFYMLFLVNSRKDITAEELSNTIQLSEKSCSSFKRKMLNAEKAMKGKSKDKSGWERYVFYFEEE